MRSSMCVWGPGRAGIGIGRMEGRAGIGIGRMEGRAGIGIGIWRMEGRAGIGIGIGRMEGRAGIGIGIGRMEGRRPFPIQSRIPVELKLKAPFPIELKIKGNGIRVRVVLRVGASMVDSSSDNFAKRIEQAWFISQQPTPIPCSSCNTNGHIECKWCAGTGFFIIGDNMLCEVPSRNTSCVICGGKGSTQCSDCQGTGFRAKWLEKPPQVSEE